MNPDILTLVCDPVSRDALEIGTEPDARGRLQEFPVNSRRHRLATRTDDSGCRWELRRGHPPTGLLSPSVPALPDQPDKLFGLDPL